jgi:hypothetical protein
MTYIAFCNPPKAFTNNNGCVIIEKNRFGGRYAWMSNFDVWIRVSFRNVDVWIRR